KVEHFRLRVVESNEKVLRVNDFLQGVVNLKQKIVKVCSLIEGMNDVGEDQALRFHALTFRDVLVGNDDALNVRIGQAIGGHGIEPAELAGASAQAAAAGDSVAVPAGNNGRELLLNRGGVGSRVKSKERLADELPGRIAQ